MNSIRFNPSVWILSVGLMNIIKGLFQQNNDGIPNNPIIWN